VAQSPSEQDLRPIPGHETLKERTPPRRGEAAGAFVDESEDSVQSILKHYAFAKDADWALTIGRFEASRLVFAKFASAG
jgi:hypothetical protein